SSEGLQLFPGGNQSSRFSKSFQKFLQREDFGADITVEDLGSHSLRKGAKMKNPQNLKRGKETMTRLFGIDRRTSSHRCDDILHER
ncbi:MAG: hypothetical protein AAGJ80_12685, partial [Cyanobacteria bacterium J06553_1]